MNLEKNIFHGWKPMGVVNPDEIPTVTLDGYKQVKQPATEYFAKYAEYKVNGGITPFAPAIEFEGAKLYFFPRFCVLEVEPLTEKTTYFLFGPNVANEFEAKVIVAETMTAFPEIQILRDAVRFVKDRSN